MLKIVEGEDYDAMTIAVQANQGYCPCVPRFAWHEDVRCVCKEFLQQTEKGHCHCRRYEKIEVEELS